MSAFPSRTALPARSADRTASGTPGSLTRCLVRIRSSSWNTSGVERPLSAIATTQWYSPSTSAGLMFSPRPLPMAVPPSRQNGTSLPRAAASRSRSERGTFVCQSASHATRVAAASLLPPAIPPATGIRLRSASDTPSSTPVNSASSLAARTARFVPSVGIGPTGSPITETEIPSSAGRTLTSSYRPIAW